MKIYVGNLSFDTSEEDLKNAFESFGQVEEAKIIFDRYTGQSRGFGFVEMSDAESATKAINEMNEKELQGRQLKVNEARPREERGGGGRGGGGGGRDRW